MLKKLKSRKFILSFLSMIAAGALALGAEETCVKMIFSIASVIIPIIYTIVEGSIDKAAVLNNVQELLNVLQGETYSIEDSSSKIADEIEKN